MARIEWLHCNSFTGFLRIAAKTPERLLKGQILKIGSKIRANPFNPCYRIPAEGDHPNHNLHFFVFSGI
jgi:hypothetical protein